MSLESALNATTDDETIRFALTVRNRADEPVSVQFSDSCRADVAVVDDDEEIWRYTEGRMFAQTIGEERFDPGESRTFEVSWDDPRPGSYTAVGDLTARDCSCEARTSFSV